MKESDELFKTLYQQVYFSGSYYDGLKIGKPDEFDLNIVIDKTPFKDLITLVEGSQGDMFKMELKHPGKNLPGHNVLQRKDLVTRFMNLTGKSLSVALNFATTNPQYDDRLFIELQVLYL